MTSVRSANPSFQATNLKPNTNCIYTMHKSFLKSLVLVVVTAFALTLSPTAFAQITTAGMSGTLRAADGKALSGVTVTAVHTPTNASFTAVTSAAGRFTFVGLPVGGPFTLSAKTDVGEATNNGVFTELGNEVEVSLYAKSDTVQLEKLVVGGRRGDLNAFAQGSGTILDRVQLDAKPTTERSFADLVSATPQVTLQALSSANDREEAHIVALGQNNRFNSFMIDGARINDVFGLNGTGLAAFFNPISPDTLDQMSVQVSPYSANFSFFTGAAINAVTKSGSNTFHGSAYYYFKGDQLYNIQLQGNNPKEQSITGVKILPKLERITYGGTFSGPLWKDHIFFFLNYEKYSSVSNGRTLTFTPDAGVEDQILARLKQYSSTVNWGDKVTAATTNAQSEKKMLAKVDWNISDKHRLTVRYSKTDGLVPQFGNLGGGVTINGVASSAIGAAPTGHFYNQTRVGKSYSAQFNSDWTSDFKTELRFTRNTDDQLTPTASTAPLIVINGLTGTDLRTNVPGTGAYVAGTEQFRHGNVINVVNRQASAKADYFWNNFVFTGGVEREWSDFVNLFRSGSYGLVAFRNLADFLADTNGVISRNYYDPAVRPVADISDFAINSIYGQAKWNYSNRLNATFGLRVDKTDTSISPALNQTFLTTTGFRNDGTPGGVTAIAPRFGFNYSLDDKRITQIHGGAGYFMGRSPWVFFSNSFGNTGVGTFSRASTDVTNPLTNSLTSYFTSEFNAANPIGTGTDNPTLRREVDFNDNHVKMPAVWRANLNLDHKLPFLDSMVTVEYDYTRVAEGLITTNENLKPLAGALALDGRARFSGTPGTQANALYPAYTNMYRVSNTNVGQSNYVTLEWSRPMKNNWSFRLAYSRGHSTEAQSNSQTTAGGQFLRNIVFNQNTVELSTADYEIKDRLQFNLSRQFEFIKKAKTTVALYYEGRSGNPESWVFGGDLNGDGQSFNDTVVIPTGPSDPKFDFSGMTQPQQDAFFKLISDSGLAKYAGQKFVPKNSFYEPWVNRLDLNFRQDIPIHGSAKLQFGLDFVNFGAFLSKSTFGYTEVAPNQSNDAFRTLTLTSGTSYNNATGQIKPLFSGTVTATNPNGVFLFVPNQIDNLQSRWRIQLVAKLMF